MLFIETLENRQLLSAVTGFTLINTDTGKTVGSLVEGQTVDLGTTGKDLTVLASTDTPIIGSVRFAYDANTNFGVENYAPFALNHKINSGGYYAWTPAVGSHTVKATPFAAQNATGATGTALTVDFKVIDSGAPTAVPTGTSPNIQVSITNPINGASQAGPGYYVVRTSTSDTAGSVSKVVFYVNGSILGTADAAPFTMAWENAAPGSYSLVAVASDSSGSKTSSAVKVTITAPAAGRTIYVSPSGKNTNTGLSTSSELQTITAAANIAQPGDTVVIEPGTYREEVKVPRGGTATAPVTFKAAQAGTVIIDGADPLGGWTRNSGTNPVYTTPWNHDFLDQGVRYYGGFTTDGTTTTVGYAEQFLYNGAPLTQVLSLSSLKAGDFYVNYSARTVSIWAPGGAAPTSGNILASTRAHLFYPASTSVQYVRVDGLIMQHAANFSQNQAVQTATGWRILNSTVQWVGAGAIMIKGNDILLLNDHALHNGQMGIGGTGVNDLFLHDETAFNNYKQFSCFHEAGGGKFAGSDGFYFDQYYAHNNIGPGLWFDVGNTNYVVVNGYFYNNVGRVQNYEGVGVLLEISDGPGRVEYSTFYGNTGASLDICESMNVTAAHNTFSGTYLEVRDETTRAPHHLYNIHVFSNGFLNSFICNSVGNWSTSSGATKHLYFDGDTFEKTGPLYYWAGGSYTSLSTIFSTLGFERTGKIGDVAFSAAPSLG